MSTGTPMLFELDEANIHQNDLAFLLEKASLSSCARPMYSGFHVHGSSTSWPWGMHAPLHSGNVEYGYYQAIHNEEAATVALIATHGANTPNRPILALVNGNDPGSLETITMPCGNCRDILLDALGPECAIVAGTHAGGLALFTRLKDILYDRYESIQDTVLADADMRVFNGSSVHSRTKNPYRTATLHPLREYCVALSTYSPNTGAQTYIGASHVGADFHPVYAGEVAVLQTELARDPFLNAITVVAEGNGAKPPDVLYRDRQSLLGYAIDCELVTGRPHEDLEIHLYTCWSGELTGAWKTTMKKWLPVPFSQLLFGEEFLTGYTAYLKEFYVMK